MPSRKQVQKKIKQKPGAINSVEKAIERLNDEQLLNHAKRMNKPVYELKKDTHTGIVTKVLIEPNKHKSKPI